MTLLGGCSNAPFSDLELRALVLTAPEALDFGTIPTEEPYEASFEVENIGQVAVEILGAFPLPGSLPAGVSLTATADLSTLAPGGKARVTVRVQAASEPPSDVLGAVTLDVAGLNPDDPRIPIVEVRGKVSPSGLVVEPNPITIGPVPFTETGTAGITIRNLRRSGLPIVVYAVFHRSGRARYDEAITRGTFGLLPTVDRDGRIVTLGPGERFDYTLSYTAPDSPGEAKEQAIWSITTCPNSPEECRTAVVVQGIPDVEGPRARINPRAGVHFGQIPLGNEFERRLVIGNQGGRPLVVTDVVYTGSPQLQVDLTALDGARVGGGRQIEIPVSFEPTTEALQNGELTFRTNDPLNRSVSLRISGAGVVLPPCRFEASPAAIDFGTVELNEAGVEGISIRNTGDEDCVLFDPQIIPGNGTEPNTFSFQDAPPVSIRLRPGEDIRLILRFVPPSPGQRRATLRVRTAGEENIEIPLVGNTPEGSSLICSPEQVTQVERPVTLNALLAGGGAATYRWRVLTAPGGSAGSWRLSPNPPTGPSADLTPLALGLYEVEVQVETEEGDNFSCTMTVNARSSGLVVTLTWDGPGDLDLHLRRDSRLPWFSSADCYFDNMRAEWIPGPGAGSGPNPNLDVDDVDGDGPENIRLSEPRMSVRYTIGVSHFERAAGRTARVQVSCGRASTVLDVQSRPFRGRETGNCSRNDFWKVATLTFFAPDQCNIEMIDTYVTTQQACQNP